MQSMAKGLHLRLAGFTRHIMNRDLHDLAAYLGCAENKIEIAPLVCSPFHPQKIFFIKGFGAAERIGQMLLRNKRHQKSKQFIAQQIQCTHGLVLHGIDQARSVDELTARLI